MNPSQTSRLSFLQHGVALRAFFLHQIQRIPTECRDERVIAFIWIDDDPAGVCFLDEFYSLGTAGQQQARQHRHNP